MNTQKPAFRAVAQLASRSRRTVAAVLLPLLAGAFVPGAAVAQTSVVPNLISYQGKITNSSGALVGSGTPVNRLVIFRIWGHQSNSTVADLLYSEQQTVTISEGEFSVLIGQGTAVSGTPLGYSEAAKGPPTVTFANAAVFGGAARYLGVTIDDGTAAADPEVSPRQQLVTSAYAMRAKFAESLGANGATTLTALDSGNVGVGTANPTVRLDVNGVVNVFDGGAKGYAGGLASEAGGNLINFGMNDSRFGSANTAQPGGFVRVDPRGDTTGDLFQVFGRAAGVATSSQLLGITSSGKVGIGQAAPGFPLTFSTALGDKISLWGNSGAHYGFGIQTNLLQIHTDSAGTDVVFGYGSSAALTETMRIKGNGSVGIGTASPGSRLQVVGGVLASNFTAGGIADSSYSLSNSTSATVGSLGTASAAGNYSTDSAVGDIILRAQSGKVLIQSGVGASALAISSTNNVSIGRSTASAKLHVAGNIKVDGTNFIELGAGLTKEANAGKIGYNSFSTDALDIVGAGATGVTRKIKFWNEGGANFVGPIYADGGIANTFTLLSYLDFSGGQNPTDATRSDLTHSIVAAYRIQSGGGFDVASDLRIKQVTGRSNAADDLAKLQRIEVTDYTFRDSIRLGSGQHKKVIAQQVESVFPQAVNRSVAVVPDIMQKCAVVDGWIQVSADLRKGDRVRLIDGITEAVHEVVESQAGRVRTTWQPNRSDVFVYGREVSDFRTVDYDAISMLNVSATQEIKREKDAEVAALRAQNEALTRRVAELELKDRARDARLASIEKLLQAGQTVMASPAKTSTSNGQE